MMGRPRLLLIPACLLVALPLLASLGLDRQQAILRYQVLDKLAGQQRHQLLLVRFVLAAGPSRAAQQVEVAPEPLLHIGQRLFERGVQGLDIALAWLPVAVALV